MSVSVIFLLLKDCTINEGQNPLLKTLIVPLAFGDHHVGPAPGLGQALVSIQVGG